jgi:hypothetical protein
LFVFVLSLVLPVCWDLLDAEKSAPENPETPVLDKTALLTDNTWIYVEFYQNWQQPNQVLAYKRGNAGNIIDYTPNRVKFFKDGSFEETQNNGQFRAGIWQLRNNETELWTGSSAYTNNVTLIKLTADSLVWHDVANRSYGVQIAKK